MSGESTAYRPRRSVLYMPSSNERALEKAKTLPVDALILDLEDAVAPDAKEVARENACAAAQSGDYGRRELTIRVNGIGSQWHDADLAAAAAAGPDAIVVPKVGSADEVRSLVAAMEAAGAPAHTRLWAMVETPVRGAARRGDRAGLRPARLPRARHQRPLQGARRDVRARAGRRSRPRSSSCCSPPAPPGWPWSTGSTTTSRTPTASSPRRARAARWASTARPSSTRARSSRATRSSRPSADEVEQARAVIAAFEAAQAEGRGVATLNGRLIENLHVDTAQKVLATAEAIAAL